MAKLAFFQEEIWHILEYNEMHIFQVFYNFYYMFFEVEVGCNIGRYGIPNKRTIY